MFYLNYIPTYLLNIDIVLILQCYLHIIIMFFFNNEYTSNDTFCDNKC